MWDAGTGEQALCQPRATEAGSWRGVQSRRQASLHRLRGRDRAGMGRRRPARRPSGPSWGIATGHERGVQPRRPTPRLRTGSADKTVRLWDVATGAQALHASWGMRHRSSPWRSAPTASIVLTAGNDNTARLWDARTGTPIGTPLVATRAMVIAVAFSPDGQRLAHRQLPTRRRGCGTPPPASPSAPPWSTGKSVNNVAFSPDGTRLLTGKPRQDRAAVGRRDRPAHRHPGAWRMGR